MVSPTLTPAEREERLQTLAKLLPSAVLDSWEEIHLRYAAVVDASAMECAVVRLDESVFRVNPSYKVVRLLPELRAGMHQPGRGTWFTMRYMLDQSGRYQVEFDYDSEPAFDFTIKAEAYAADLQQFPRSEAFMPFWLRERLAGR